MFDCLCVFPVFETDQLLLAKDNIEMKRMTQFVGFVTHLGSPANVCGLVELH